MRGLREWEGINVEWYYVLTLKYLNLLFCVRFYERCGVYRGEKGRFSVYFYMVDV